jgi:uncharacterized protein (DUF58 family)
LAVLDIQALLARAERLELKTRFLARSQYAGLYQSAFRGQGIEFMDVREYADGDDVRLIDWNVSARSQSLYVKRMVEERERNLLIMLDTSGSLRFGSARRTKFELLVELAALFILSGFYARDRVSLAVIRSKVEIFVPPAKGWTHAARLIREIIFRRPEGSAAEMEAVWSFLNSPSVPRSFVILLTDFQVPLAPSNEFAVTCRKHELVIVLVSDPRERELPPAGRVRVQDPETGEVRTINTNNPVLRLTYERKSRERRETLLGMLRGGGIDWVEFDTHAEYEGKLRRFLQMRASKRGYRYR